MQDGQNAHPAFFAVFCTIFTESTIHFHNILKVFSLSFLIIIPRKCVKCQKAEWQADAMPGGSCGWTRASIADFLTMVFITLGGTYMITVEHLTKRYGDFTAVSDLSFEIEEGHIYGFLGPNGAGKSTTMNIMTGCLSATEGTVKIDGYDIFEDAYKAKKLIGYLPEQPPLYLNETVEEYLRFVGEAKGVKKAELQDQIEEVMDRTKITQMRYRRIGELSKGYRQRVGIAQALLGSPRVIILDEPTVGLDPIQIIEIRDLIRELGRTHTVILSSHILSEVQAICDQILIISKGRLVAFGEPEKLMEQLLTPDEITIMTEADRAKAEEILAEVGGITQTEWSEKDNGRTSALIRISGENIYDVSKDIFFAFARHNTALLELSLKHASLEDVFIELTEGDEEDVPAAEGRPEITGEDADLPAGEERPEITGDGENPASAEARPEITSVESQAEGSEKESRTEYSHNKESEATIR